MQAHVKEVTDRFVAALEREAGEIRMSLVLYGSAARAEHLAGYSDLNLLLVADRLDPAALRHLGAAIETLRGHTRVPPLFLTRDEWRRAADVFPIEITDMQLARQVLLGPDPVAGCVVSPADLRRALERELRGKLLRIRQGYAVYRSDPAALGGMTARSVASVAILLRGVLALAGDQADGPTTEAIRRAAVRIGFDGATVLAVHGRRGTVEAKALDEEVERYLSAIGRVVEFVDQFQPGGR